MNYEQYSHIERAYRKQLIDEIERGLNQLSDNQTPTLKMVK